MKFGILVFGIRKSAQGIRNPTNDWNPESKFHWRGVRNPSSTDKESKVQWQGIQSVESWIQDCLGSPHKERHLWSHFLFYHGFPRLKNVRIYSGDFVTTHVPAFLEGEAFCWVYTDLLPSVWCITAHLLAKNHNQNDEYERNHGEFQVWNTHHSCERSISKSREIITGISRVENKLKATLALYMYVSFSLVSHTLVCLDKPLKYDIAVFYFVNR